MKNNTTSSVKSPKKVSILAIVAIVVGGLTVLVIMVVAATKLVAPAKNIDSFQSCKDAGGVVMETYPEQCSINGKSYTNTTPKSGESSYVGLSEQAALDKAKSENKAARVVERDGEALAVTMDFSAGRLNLYVKNGNVYKVTVEGQQ